jgi:hypothetical protein
MVGIQERTRSAVVGLPNRSIDRDGRFLPPAQQAAAPGAGMFQKIKADQSTEPSARDNNLSAANSQQWCRSMPATQ